MLFLFSFFLLAFMLFLLALLGLSSFVIIVLPPFSAVYFVFIFTFVPLSLGLLRGAHFYFDP